MVGTARARSAIVDADTSSFGATSFIRRLAEIEKTLRGRLGVWVLDTQSRRDWSYRAGEPFPLAGGLKVVASAALLARADDDKERLDRRIRFTSRDVLPNSPVTQGHAGEGLTLTELCSAAIAHNDRTAGHLLLQRAGGPEGLTSFMRSLGDSTTRLDRRVVLSSGAWPGDLHGTTTPAAFGASFKALLLGSTLSHPSRRLLTSWLLGNKVGRARLRAGLPPGWDIGNKTGADANGTTSDVAIVWPPNHRPLIVSVFITAPTASIDERNGGIAEVARLLSGLVPK